jgi:hypothetical protein
MVLTLGLTLAGVAGRHVRADHHGPALLAQTDGGSGGGSGDGQTSGSSNSGSSNSGSSNSGDSGNSGSGDSGDSGGGGQPSAPNTTTNVPERETATGHPTRCPEDTPANVDCYTYDGSGDVRAVRVGGGTLVVVPTAHADGTSNSSSNSNVTYTLKVDRRTYNIYERERPRRSGQKVLLTIALLLVVLLAAAGGALFERRRRGRPPTPPSPPAPPIPPTP